MKILQKIKCWRRGYHIEKIVHSKEYGLFAYMACKDCGEYWGYSDLKYNRLVLEGKIRREAPIEL